MNPAFLQPTVILSDGDQHPQRSADGRSGVLSTLTVLCHDHEARKMTALLHLKKHPLMISRLGSFATNAQHTAARNSTQPHR